MERDTKNATSSELIQLLTNNLSETEKHITRVEQVLAKLGKKLKAARK